MANYKPSKKQLSDYKVGKFIGLNCDNELELNVGEAVDMANFRVTQDYRLEKREGYKPLKIDYTATPNVQSNYFSFLKNWFGKLTGDAKTFYYQIVMEQNAETARYYLYVLRVDIETLASTHIFSVMNTLTLPTVNVFYKSGYLYMHGNFGYYKFDGATVSNIAGTIPTTFTNCSANLATKTVYQPINLLIAKRKIYYNNISYSVPSIEITLPEVGIASVNDFYVSGTGSFTPTTDYTVNLATGKITVTRDFGANREIIITYTATVTGQRELITNCTQSMFYGGANDTDMFVWGNPDHPNTIYHTYNGDVEHFGIYNYRTFGNETVTDVVAMNTTQVIFTDKAIHSATTEFTSQEVIVGTTATTVYTITYPTKVIRYERGNKAGFNVQTIDNNPTFLSSDNAIWQLFYPNTKDERNIKYISQKVQKQLSQENLTGGFNIDWETKGEYWLVANGTAYIWNYRNNTWYKFTNMPVVSEYQLVGETLYFMKDNYIYKFDKEYSCDYENVLINYVLTTIEKAIEAYVEFPYNGFGRDELTKSITKLFVTSAVSQVTDTYLRVEYWTSENTIADTKDFFLEAGSTPKTFFQEISATEFTYFKMKIYSDKIDSGSKILNYDLKIQFNGDVN